MKQTYLFGAAAVLLIAGCGGGGNSGGGARNVALMPITADNAVAVTAASYEAAQSSAEFGDLAGSTGLIAGSPGQTAKLDGSFASEVGGSSPQAQVPIPETVQPCDFDGDFVLSGHIEDPLTPTLTARDWFKIEFRECYDVPEEMTDGTLRMDIEQFSGDFLSALYDLTMKLTLTGFRVVTLEEDVQIDGDVTVRLDTEETPYIEASVSGREMGVVTDTRSETLLEFVSTQTFDGTQAPAPYTFSGSGTLESSRIAGAVRYSTLETFQGVDNDYPSTGVFRVQGENSEARLTALDNVRVLIEIDADGVEGFEQEIETTWQELTSQ